MGKTDDFTLKGHVVDVDRGCKFKVSIDDNPDIIVECTLSGKLRQNYIRIINGDSVDVSVSSADPKKGRITWRYKQYL